MINKKLENGSTAVSDRSKKVEKIDKKPESERLKKLEIIDKEPGYGPTAASGKMVHVSYVGRLNRNKKEFDRNLKGFSFRLGKGEVIKGWEKGLENMKVGGKRLIRIPASLAYGSKKSGPIPPNSDLEFEVQLKAVTK